MAKSSGGAMTVLTGKLAGMVGYRIANSKTPQGFREYRGVIKNPQTAGQRVQRARFATVVAAAAQLASIVDHSFEGVTGATLNRGRFVRENIAMMKERTVDFLNRNEHRMSANPFVIANGTLAPVQVDGLFPLTVEGSKKQSALTTTLDIADIATATPNSIFPNYVAGVQCTVIFVRYKGSELTNVTVGGTTYVYPKSTYVDKARFVFNPNSDAACFLPIAEGSSIYKLNPEAINDELSLNWAGLRFTAVSGVLYISDPLADETNYFLLGGAVVMSERTSASHRYSRAIMYHESRIIGEGANIGTAGNPLSIASASFEDGGGSEVFPSDKYLNNADNL